MPSTPRSIISSKNICIRMAEAWSKSVLAPGRQVGDGPADLGRQRRLAAGDGHHGGAALLDGGQTLLDAQVLAEHVAGILDLAAAGAGQVAAEERLQHQDQRVALAAA